MPTYDLKKFHLFTPQKAIFFIHEQTYFISFGGGLITVINSRQMSNNTYSPGPAHFNANLMRIILLDVGEVTIKAPL